MAEIAQLRAEINERKTDSEITKVYESIKELEMRFGDTITQHLELFMKTSTKFEKFVHSMWLPIKIKNEIRDAEILRVQLGGRVYDHGLGQHSAQAAIDMMNTIIENAVVAAGMNN
jgi:hypothetical protein